MRLHIAAHALMRIKQRFKSVPTHIIAAQLTAGVNDGTVERIATGVNGHSICATILESGEWIYPVIDRRGELRTVLTDGMTCNGERVFFKLEAGAAHILDEVPA